MLKFRYAEKRPSEAYLPSVMRMSNRAPHLEYFSIFDGDFHFFKRVRGEWVFCDMEEFPH
jgi:hypothetical protein